MSKLLKNLPLSLPTGALIEPFCFGETTKNALSKWLNDTQIEALERCAEVEKHNLVEEKETPSLGEEREVLERVSELAFALAKILEQAPNLAAAELDLMFHRHMGGFQQKEITATKLSSLAFHLGQRLDQIPKQSRRKSPAFFVRQIAGVLEDAGIEISVGENSRFFKITTIVFKSVGIYQSPAAAIRVIMGK